MFEQFGIFVMTMYWSLGITVILLVISVSINIYQYKKYKKGRK